MILKERFLCYAFAMVAVVEVMILVRCALANQIELAVFHPIRNETILMFSRAFRGLDVFVFEVWLVYCSKDRQFRDRFASKPKFFDKFRLGLEG